MTQQLVFHESFDSVRTRSGDSDIEADPNLAQVQAEALLTLLLGRTVVINNSLAFDSRSTLFLADVVFEAAARVADRSGQPVSQLYATTPFVLRRFRADTLFKGCADQLRRLTPATNRFILSAWHHITDDDRARLEFANILDRLDAGDAPEPLPSFLTDYPLALQQFATLRRLNQYLIDHPETNGQAVNPKASVPERVASIQAMPMADFLDLARRAGCREDRAEVVYRAVKRKQPEEVNRAWAHGPQIQEDLQDDAPLLRELVDTLQNAVLAESAEAEIAYLSTPPRSRNVVADAEVNRLALEVARLGQSYAGSPMSGVFDTVAGAQNLPVQPLPTIYEGYWALIADEPSRNSWTTSCRRVNRLLEHRGDTPEWRELFAEAWADHIALLQSCIGTAVQQQGDSLRLVGAHNGQHYDQTNSPGGFEFANLAEATAAGEYLDMIVRAAR